MAQMSPDEPIHGRPASAFLPPTLLRMYLPYLDENDEVSSGPLENMPKLSFDPKDISLAAQLMSMEEGMTLRIRSHRWIPDDEITGHTPEALDKSDENIDYEALD